MFNLNDSIPLLAPRGSIITVGLLGLYEKQNDNMETTKYSKSEEASSIGSVSETQEVIDFCSEHNRLSNVQLNNVHDVNDAFDKIKDEDVGFRYVIDINSLKLN